MRIFTFIMLILLSATRTWADSLASPTDETLPFTATTASGAPLCPMSQLCSQNPSAAADWADQMSNLDLMKEEMAKLHLTNWGVTVGVIDTGASKAIAREHRGHIQYQPFTKHDDLVDAWDDSYQHGTSVAEMIRRLAPGDITVYYSNQPSVTGAELSRAVELACEKNKIVNVSWNNPDQGHTFEDGANLQKRMMDKGCLVLIAAGNTGGKNQDHFTSIGALDRAGKLAQFPTGHPDNPYVSATKGDLYAPGDRIPAQMWIRPKGLPQCNHDTYLESGSSIAAPQATAVARNVREILMQSGEFRNLEPIKQVSLIEGILHQSAINGRIDGYRAVKLAEDSSKLDQVASALENLRAKAHHAWELIRMHGHNAAAETCSSQSNCGARMTCYKEKRRYLAGVDPASRAGQDAIKDLFLTAQNSGDYELAANWAAQLKGVSKSEMNAKVDWSEFRKRVAKTSNTQIVADYLTSVQRFMSVPADLQIQFPPEK